MSELERAIGGRFDLPNLDMSTPPAAAAPVSALNTAPRPQAFRPSESNPNAQAARPPEIALNQQLARSLELAAACLRRNEVDRARRLLEDVVRSGDETQREFARALLSRLG
jgi:FimV-like protein